MIGHKASKCMTDRIENVAIGAPDKYVKMFRSNLLLRYLYHF